LQCKCEIHEFAQNQILWLGLFSWFSHILLDAHWLDTLRLMTTASNLYQNSHKENTSEVVHQALFVSHCDCYSYTVSDTLFCSTSNNAVRLSQHLINTYIKKKTGSYYTAANIFFFGSQSFLHKHKCHTFVLWCIKSV
jgi:hypothetical protein